MSFDAVAKKEFDMLSNKQQSAIVDLMLLLNSKNAGGQSAKNNVPYNAFAGGLHYMSDDFDEIPEGFEDYL